MFDVLGGGNRRGGMSPIALAVLGTLAYKALKNKGGLGGLLAAGQGAPTAANPERRADTGPTGSASAMPPASAGGSGGLLGSLGGGGLALGLRDLLDRFRQGGQEEKAQSWVSTGENRPIATSELEQVLGSERIEWLMQQTGLPKDQLLAGLSSELPSAIDKLTPNGNLPTEDELAREIGH
jgi:uncharacterized protein YidB (DUF937 family)